MRQVPAITGSTNGEEQAWRILAELEPEDVCSRAKADFDKLSGLYVLKSFHQDIFISPQNKEISGHSPVSDLLLNKLDYYSRLSILWYLINAKNIPFSGELKKPSDMTGGLIFLRGTHVLPLDKIAERYGNNIEEFIKRGKKLGGEQLNYGDASIRLSPFPRVPAVVILWKNDNEFSSRSDILFDSTGEAQLPIDIIWSTAMMSLLIML